MCSGVWDHVNLGDPVLMLFEFSLVEGVKVALESFCQDRLDLGFASLRSTVQLEGLIHCLIGCLEFELLRLIVRDPKHTQVHMQ